MEGVYGEGEVGDEFASRDEDDDCDSHEETPVNKPQKGQQPPLCRVTSDIIPAKYHVETESHACNQRCEEHQSPSCKIEQRLEYSYLRSNLEGLKLRQRASARGLSSPRHREFPGLAAESMRMYIR